jgi:hypothetical protein
MVGGRAGGVPRAALIAGGRAAAGFLAPAGLIVGGRAAGGVARAGFDRGRAAPPAPRELLLLLH